MSGRTDSWGSLDIEYASLFFKYFNDQISLRIFGIMHLHKAGLTVSDIICSKSSCLGLLSKEPYGPPSSCTTTFRGI